MRKWHHEKIVKYIEIVRNLANEIKRLYKADRHDAILQPMKDAAMLLGKIESYVVMLEGEGTRTAQEINELRTIVIEIHDKTKIKKKINNSAIRLIDKYLDKISDTVFSDLKPTRFEAVFISSRQSTSDSLETVYFAAKLDPDCDAYYIPLVPPTHTETLSDQEYYKEKNIDIITFLDYDIEIRHPDVVYFDYPYAEYGIDIAKNAGCEYFFEYLRKHCRLLVHIPYFSISNEGKLIEYLNYTTTPGIVYSNYVMLQSESARQGAITEYNSFDQILWIGDFGSATDKFVAIGSPKFDKLVTTRADDYQIPDTWRKYLYNSAGNRKKAILYNTHFKPFVDGGVQYLNRLISVLNLLNNHDEMVFWWRPHPSVDFFIKSSRPELLTPYREFVNICVRDGLAIYDDTPDLHRAIAMTDALYGDYSSLEPLYLALGKPVMRQNPELIINETDIRKWDCSHFSFKDNMSDIEDMIYFESPQCNIVDLLKYVAEEKQLYTEPQKEILSKLKEDRFGYLDGSVGAKIHNFCKEKLM